LSEPVTDSPVLELPLGDWHRARGARMVPFAGYAMPIQYEGIMAEHLWTRENAGLFDVSHMGQLFLSGEGLDDALESVLPTDVRSLAVGRQRYSLLLNEEGGILDDLMFSRWPQGIYMVVNGAVKHQDIAWLRAHLPDAITLEHRLDRTLFTTGGRFTLAGVDAWISRTGYTGEDGFEISVPAGEVARIADLLCAEPEVKPIGLGARDSLRLEAGLPLYGHDLDPGVSPVGSGLMFAIQKRRREEGGFIGHARIARELAEGAPARRVGLSIAGKLPAREGAKIFLGDAEVGTVTSGGFAPSVGAPIAMGWVASAHAADGTALEIEVRGKRIAATVAPMPFVPHHYRRKPA